MTNEAEVQEYIRLNDPTSANLAGKFGLSPDKAEEYLEEYASTGWHSLDFTDVAFNQFPPRMVDRRQWMAHVEKKPYAPWGNEDAPAPCSKDGHTTADVCGCDARWKWGFEANYLDGESVAMAMDDPMVDGRAFLQHPHDPFAYVDGDDVRCPEDGSVHPKFLEILDRLGATYADISQSGEGVHAIYLGELPEGVKEASWQLDDEPWGEIDDELPSIEIYAGKRVCVMTGNRVKGSMKEACEWDEDELVQVLDEHDQLPEPNENRNRADYDKEDYDPDASESDEWTTDIRDLYHAIDRIDAREVAGRTIVSQWNDEASTTGQNRAFYPDTSLFGSASSGTANIVNSEIWQDTGDVGGYGGPVVMALIAEREVPVSTTPDEVQGRIWFKGVELLREMGYSIPKLVNDEKPSRDDLDLDDDPEDEDEAVEQVLAELKLTE